MAAATQRFPTGRARWAVFALGAAALVGGLAPAAQAADNYVTNVSRVDAVPVVNSNSFNDLSAVCPSPKLTIGGGTDIDGGTNDVALRGTQPLAASGMSNTWRGTGEETDPIAQTWTLRTSAFCALVTSPPPGGGGTTYVSDVQIVEAVSPTNTTDLKDVVATCPTGKSVISGGGDINGGGFMVAIRRSLQQDRTHWQVTGEETDPTSATWSVSVRAVCARLNSPNANSGIDTYVSDPAIVEAVTPQDSNNTKIATATCPAGKQVIGGGGDIDFDDLDVALRGTQVTASSGTAGSFRVEGEETDATASTWRVRSRAICAKVDSVGPPGGTYSTPTS